MIQIRSSHVKLIIGIGATAAAFFFSTGLNGFWPLVWIAPLSVLILAFQSSARVTAVAAFTAYVLGGLNLVPYLLSLVPLPVVAVVVVVPALAFTLAVLAQRYATLRWKSWAGVFVFPAAWTAYEYVFSLISPHGTFGNLAYTQADFLSLIQIASLTGIWGISFLLALFPTGLAVAWHRRAQQRLALPAALIPIGIIVLALSFGWARLAGTDQRDVLQVGLAATDETVRFFKTQQREEALAVVRAYANRIAELAGRGAQVIVLPEKFVGLTPAYENEAFEILGQAARQHQVSVVAGFNRVGRLPLRNSALVFGPDGQLVTEYDKVNLVPGWESGYQVGNTPGLFSISGVISGTAICKDLDFPSWLRRYEGARIVCVPAWDFVRDGRLHSRMAVLRGVEEGFAVARAAQEGLVSVSDHLGRILAEAPSSKNPDVLVTVKVPLGPGRTWYSTTGDWFGLASLALLSILLGAAAWHQRRSSLPL